MASNCFEQYLTTVYDIHMYIIILFRIYIRKFKSI